jgi:hypothetical protein
MTNPSVARAHHAERARDIERQLRTRSLAAAAGQGSHPRARRSLRRTVGRSIVRIGQAIAAEPRQPVASP